jgi:DNA polymerase-3 subunit delta'
MTITIPTVPLIGHDAIERQLLESWERGSMPHSLMFTGPQGIGKSGVALRLAAFALCGGTSGGMFGPEDLSVSPDNPALRRMEIGSHGDFKYIEPDTSTATAAIKIDAIREISNFLALTPSEAAWRVVVIDSADDLNPNAANALLKILEEPPSYCLMILISHAPGQLLPTIRSRCRMIPFKPLERAAFDKIMNGHLPAADHATLASLHALAHGSPGLAVTLNGHDALTLYDLIMAIYAHYPALDEAALDRLATRVAGAKDKALWNSWRLIWEQFLYRLQLMQSGVALPHLSDQEAETMMRLAALDAGRWHQLQDDANKLFNDTEILHLDRKQAIQSVFGEMVKS